MPSYSMADVINDPDFAQYLPNGIARDSGQFVLGKWKAKTTLVDFYGIIQPAKAKELEQIPEGDRTDGAQTFHSSSVIYITHSGETSTPDGISDVITWHNQQYRIMKVWPWDDFGYFKALGVRMSGK